MTTSKERNFHVQVVFRFPEDKENPNELHTADKVIKARSLAEAFGQARKEWQVRMANHGVGELIQVRLYPRPRPPRRRR